MVHPQDSRFVSDANVRVYTLGRFLVEVNGEPLRFETKAKRKPLELLKALISLGGESVPAELLGESLWPESDGDRAQSALATTLARLRKLIGQAGLILRDARVSLDPSHCWVDALECASILNYAGKAVDEGDDQLAWSLLDKVMELYRGPFLEGEFDPPEILSAREKLHGTFLRQLGKAGEWFQQQQDFPRAIILYRKGLEIDDLAEELYQSLMRCYLAQGRLAEGIAVYQRCSEILRARVDIEPSPETEALHHSLISAQEKKPPPDPEPSPPPAAALAHGQSPVPSKAKASGERRTATVAFFTLHGFAAMTEKLDPEEVEAITTRIKEEAVRIVESHGGIVNQFAGDETLALFGVPSAHEDDPLRAVRSALAFNDLVGSISAEVEGRVGYPLRMHGGIDTGLIVTHLRDDRDGRYGITGDAVKTGAGLAALAEPGELLVGLETNRLITPFFKTEALPWQELKGRVQPLAPFRVVGESNVQTRFEAAETRGLTPFTGREPELRLLKDGLDSALAGRGQFITIVGDAGVGKSRLLHEFQQHLHTKGVAVLQGRCNSSGSNTPYLPFLEVLRAGLGVLDEDGAGDKIERLIAALRNIDPALENFIPNFLYLLAIPSDEHALPAHLQGEELRRIMQLAIAALLTASAGQAPLVLLLEDWHWVDDPSHAVLKYLLGLITQTPLLVVVTNRPDFSAEWGNLGHHTQCMVHPFQVEESEHIIKASLGAGSLPEGLAKVIHERTDGNPFFIEEICRSLVEQGHLRVRRGKATLNEGLDNLGLPPTVQAVIRTRLDRLEPSVQDVLHLAAVIGRQFSGRILEKLVSDQAGLSETLEELKGLELIHQVRILPEAIYLFKHAITQEVAYDTLLQRRRKTVHLGVAEAIEASYGEGVGNFAEALAFHFFRGEAWAKAARYCLKAAGTAKEHYAYRSALSLCAQALEAADKDDGLEAERVETLALQGDLLSLLGELKPANAKYEEALKVAAEPARKQTISNKLHRQRSVKRNGAKIVFYEHGSGKDTLLLANPVVYGLATFQPVLERLCQEFRVITVDLRGSGASDPLPDRYFIQDHIQDVRAVIEKTGSAPIIGIGISRGGNMMVKLAVEHPGLLKAIVTVASPPDNGGADGRFPPAGPDFDLFVEALREKDKEKVLQIMVPTLISEPGTEELLQHTIEQWRRLSIHTLLSFYGDDPQANIEPLLDQVSVPALIMHGAEDRRIPVEVSHFMAERIPGALLYHFQGAGHLPAITAAGEFCEVLRQFVRTGTVPQPVPITR